jgi:hypothetical protein
MYKRPVTLCNTDARRHNMENIKIISEAGKALLLSRVKGATYLRSLHIQNKVK